MDRIAGEELVRPIRLMVLNARLLQLPSTTQTIVAGRKRSLVRVAGIVLRVGPSVAPHRRVRLVIGLIGPAPISLLLGRQGQMDKMGEVLGRCWVNLQ